MLSANVIIITCSRKPTISLLMKAQGLRSKVSILSSWDQAGGRKQLDLRNERSVREHERSVRAVSGRVGGTSCRPEGLSDRTGSTSDWSGRFRRWSESHDGRRKHS